MINLQHMRTPTTPDDEWPTSETNDLPRGHTVRIQHGNPSTSTLASRRKGRPRSRCPPWVIETVPVGEPLISCHCMVVCAKKDGKPLVRHTIRSHHSTRRDPCQNTRRNPCLMRGMDTIVWDYAKRIVP